MQFQAVSGQYFWDRDEEGEVFFPPSDDGVKRFNPMKVGAFVYKQSFRVGERTAVLVYKEGRAGTCQENRCVAHMYDVMAFDMPFALSDAPQGFAQKCFVPNFDSPFKSSTQYSTSRSSCK